MPKVIEIKTDFYKDQLPDKYMKLELTPDELEKFYEVFPGLKDIALTTPDGWQAAKIKVEITVEAFKNKPNG